MSDLESTQAVPMQAPPAPPRPPHDDPAATVRPGARGVPVVIAGETWLLSDAAPTGRVWDDVYDQATLGGACDMLTLRVAAQMLLLTCHDISLDTAVALSMAADPADLAAAVRTALFGSAEPRRTWTGWVRAALLAAGLRPEAVPPADLRDVLDMLVATGRAVPAGQWISSVAVARERAEADLIRANLAARAAAQTAAVPAPSNFTGPMP